jgi:uncharacterized protein (DUF4415 family)
MTTPKRKLRQLTDEEEARIQAGIAADPDNPELTDAELARMRPARAVLPPALYAALVSRGGRSRSEAPKVQLTLRLDRAVVGAFRATGPGWQTRMNEALARAAEHLPASAPDPAPARASRRG